MLKVKVKFLQKVLNQRSNIHQEDKMLKVKVKFFYRKS